MLWALTWKIGWPTIAWVLARWANPSPGWGNWPQGIRCSMARFPLDKGILGTRLATTASDVQNWNFHMIHTNHRVCETRNKSFISFSFLSIFHLVIFSNFSYTESKDAKTTNQWTTSITFQGCQTFQRVPSYSKSSPLHHPNSTPCRTLVHLVQFFEGFFTYLLTSDAP